MQTTITTRKARLTPEMHARIQRRLHFALDRFAPRIRTVTLAITDQNGPRGGIDKRCRLKIQTQEAGDVVIERQGANLQTLVDRITDRAGHALGRALERSRAKPRTAFNELPWLQEQNE